MRRSLAFEVVDRRMMRRYIVFVLSDRSGKILGRRRR
jgi:hypothetical protein